MVEPCPNCGERHWNFFDSAEDRRRWVAWIERPSEPKSKVVELIDKSKH
jgi:hypothetical protein